MYYYSVLITVMPRPSQMCGLRQLLATVVGGKVLGRRACCAAAGDAGEHVAHGRGAIQYRPCRFRRGLTHEREAGFDPSFPS